MIKQPHILIMTDLSWSARKSLLLYDTGRGTVPPDEPRRKSPEAHMPPDPLKLVTVSQGGTIYSVLIRGE